MKSKLEIAREAFVEARAYVSERLGSGQPVSAGILAFFPDLVASLRAIEVSGSNLDAAVAMVPAAIRPHVAEGCVVTPVYLDKSQGVMLIWPGGRRGEVVYSANTKSGRRWLRPVTFDVYEGVQRYMVSDPLPDGKRVGFDQFGRILPGLVERTSSGEHVCSWAGGKLGFSLEPGRARVVVSSGKVTLAQGSWDAVRHQAVVMVGDDAVRVSSYGEIVDEYGNVFAAGLRARNYLTVKCESVNRARGSLTRPLVAIYRMFDRVSGIEVQAVPAQMAYAVGENFTARPAIGPIDQEAAPMV